MSSTEDVSPARLRVAAVVLLGVMALIVGLTVALYGKAFTRVETVTIVADRAGLQMNNGTVVKLRGVDVGRIESAERRHDGKAEIKLSMKPESLDQIPANVNVSLAQLTAFGNKAVILSMPDRPSAQTLAGGDVIEADHVTVEVNEVLDNLQTLLTTVKPTQVYDALSAAAQALDGRGDELGETLTTADDYLKRINQDLPTLRRNFSKGTDVLRLYGDVTPDILTTLSNVTVTARTVSDRSTSVKSVLASVKSVSDSGGRFLALNGDNLERLLNRLTVTTGLLEKYSPEFACFLKGADHYQAISQKGYGGTFAAANVIASLEIGTGPYKNPDNLPDMSAAVGPKCHGMPDYRGGPIADSLMEYVDKGGPNPYPEKPELNPDVLALNLFGPLAGEGN